MGGCCIARGHNPPVLSGTTKHRHAFIAMSRKALAKLDLIGRQLFHLVPFHRRNGEFIKVDYLTGTTRLVHYGHALFCTALHTGIWRQHVNDKDYLPPPITITVYWYYGHPIVRK